MPESGTTGELGEHSGKSGIVNGIARRLKGVADGYVEEKLDEVEERIDRKLDEIDSRLAEWRDRELANRLKIVKITLVGTILVGLLSLGYSYIQHRALSGGVDEPTAGRVEPAREATAIERE